MTKLSCRCETPHRGKAGAHPTGTTARQLIHFAAVAAVAFWLGCLTGGCSEQKQPAGWKCETYDGGITCVKNAVPW